MGVWRLGTMREMSSSAGSIPDFGRGEGRHGDRPDKRLRGQVRRGRGEPSPASRDARELETG